MIDSIGYLAAGLVLFTFLMRSLRALRMLAVASNLAFLAYGYLAGIDPVLALHAALLPINLWRLHELHGASPTCASGTEEGPARQRAMPVDAEGRGG